MISWALSLSLDGEDLGEALLTALSALAEVRHVATALQQQGQRFDAA